MKGKKPAMVDQCCTVRLENRSMEFWSLARLTVQSGSRRETDCPQFYEGQGVLAFSQWCGDPKPVDLCLSSLKPSEGEVEELTSSDVQIVWMTWV